MWVMWQAVPEDKRYDMYRLYIKKVSSRSHVKPGLGQSGAKGPRFWGPEWGCLCVWICAGRGAVRRDQDEGGVRACHRGAARRPGQEDVPRVRRGREEARRGQSDRQMLTLTPPCHQSKPHARRRRAGLFSLNGKDAVAELVCRLCMYMYVFRSTVPVASSSTAPTWPTPRGTRATGRSGRCVHASAQILPGQEEPRGRNSQGVRTSWSRLLSLFCRFSVTAGLRGQPRQRGDLP